jgi:hypothetical protein
MSIKRLPIMFLVGGLVFKALLVLLWRLFRLPEALSLLTIYDPGAFFFAEKVPALFFDLRGIAPSARGTQLFEVLLIIGFGLESLLLGLIVQWVLRRMRQRPGEGTLRRTSS